LVAAKPLTISVGDCKSRFLEAKKKYAREHSRLRFFVDAVLREIGQGGAKGFPGPSNIKRRSNYL
jgi:hypothetical protein